MAQKIEVKPYVKEITSHSISLEIGAKLYIVALSKILSDRFNVPGKVQPGSTLLRVNLDDYFKMRKIGDEEFKILDHKSAQGESVSDKQMKTMIDQATNVVEVNSILIISSLFISDSGFDGGKGINCPHMPVHSCRWSRENSRSL